MSDFIESQRLVLTPSQLNRDVRTTLEQSYSGIWVEGEVSNLARPPSGHIYFSLKDNKAQLRCALFKSRGHRAKPVNVNNGDQLLVRGRISLYEPRGDYQLIADYLEPAGEGQLRQQFEALKTRLDHEGLFDPAQKKPLPEFPRRIAIVTSPSGAAVRDMLQILERRFPLSAITIVPSLVQGDQAPAELLRALQQAQELKPDIIIMTRGGGSLEDLWAFNDETLARAVYASKTPVVSAVGHEIDFTITDFVADLRAPTPSAAAELITPDQKQLAIRVRQIEQRLVDRIQRTLRDCHQTLDRHNLRLKAQGPTARITVSQQRLSYLDKALKSRMSVNIQQRHQKLQSLTARLQLRSPAERLKSEAKSIHELQLRLTTGMQRRLTNKSQQLQRLSQALRIISPLSVLERGYSITMDADGNVVQNSSAVSKDDTLITRLHQGTLTSTVTETRRK